MAEINQDTSRLIKGTAIYAAGNIGTKILSFLIVPLYTYYISTSDNGIYENLSTAASLLMPLATLQIAEAAYTRLLKKNAGEKEIIQSCYQVALTGALAEALLLLIFAQWIRIPYLYAFILFCWGQSLLNVMQRLLRGLGFQKRFALSGIFYTVVYLFFNVIQIVYYHMGILALLDSAVIASVISAVLILARTPALRVNPLGTRDFSLIHELLAFSVPLIPNQINWWVMNSSDKLLITWFLGLSENGIYGITVKFPTLLLMLLDFFNNSWMDLTLSSKQSPENFRSRVFESLYVFSFTLIVWLLPLSQWIIEWVMAPAYKTAGLYLGFLYLGTVFQSFSSYFGVGYLQSGKTGKASSTSIYGALVNLGVNLLLIGIIGLQAASLSTFLGFFVMWLIRYRQNASVLKVEINWHLFGFYFMLSVLAIAFCFSSSFWIKLLLVSAGLINFFISNRKMILTVLLVLKKTLLPSQ